jgi:acyl-CoA hydrolase
MWIDYGFGICQPDAFDAALAARVQELRGVKLRGCITLRPRAIHAADPTGEHILSLNWHFSGYDRRQHDAGRCNYIPLNLGEWPDLYRRFIERVDIAIIQACPKDADGFYNFSAANAYHRALVEKARIVIVEVNPSLPWCHGQENAVHEDGVRKSRVVVDLPGGTIVTVPRTDVMYAVTEYGMVCLKGTSVAERATAMISIAHPDFREELERDAYAKGLIPRA